MERPKTFLISRIKDVFWVLAMAGLVAAIGRLATGLGAASNMSDALPWGLWKIFNMVAGAALATSGFVVACIIYIFQLEKYRPVARLAILIGFLGYGSSLTALLFDIGLPHRGWHPFLMWNAHSFLFEVFWCVSIYWMVTAFELVPVITERFPFPRFTHFLHEVALPIVILGITLSTMHHSSLGSLFMVSPTRLHPLWHTTWVPVEFFTSAMGAGLAVIVLITIIYGFLYNKPHNFPMLGGLAKASAALLILYFIIRGVDFTIHNKWSYVFGENLTWEGYVYMAEIALQVIVPAIIFLIPAARKSAPALATAGVAAFIGLTMHRIDVGIVGYFTTANATYFPNLAEFALGLGVPAAAGLLFFFILEHFYVMQAPESCGTDPHGPDSHDHGAHPDAAPQWTLEELKNIFLSPDILRIGTIIVITIPLAYFAFYGLGIAVKPFSPPPEPTQAAMGADETRSEITIDGNRNGMAVTFSHQTHKEGFECIVCHNISMPKDHANPCYQCHKDMYIPTQIFNHEDHHDFFGGKKSCANCHDLSKPKGGENAKACIDCHGEKAEYPMEGLDKYVMGRRFTSEAPGYKDTMHAACLPCHRRLGEENKCMAEKPGETKPCYGNCTFCHPHDKEESSTAMNK